MLFNEAKNDKAISKESEMNKNNPLRDSLKKNAVGKVFSFPLGALTVLYQPNEMLSMSCSSSLVNGAESVALMLSRICCGFDAPIKTPVTSSFWSNQASAISASFSPRCFAKSLS